MEKTNYIVFVMAGVKLLAACMLGSSRPRAGSSFSLMQFFDLIIDTERESWPVATEPTRPINSRTEHTCRCYYNSTTVQ